eukprot:1046667-Amphidinium_carterae.2
MLSHCVARVKKRKRGRVDNDNHPFPRQKLRLQENKPLWRVALGYRLDPLANSMTCQLITTEDCYLKGGCASLRLVFMHHAWVVDS